MELSSPPKNLIKLFKILQPPKNLTSLGETGCLSSLHYLLAA